ncbi:hypothetical protein GCM10027053_51670 [Intrasporangium mesophilum]
MSTNTADAFLLGSGSKSAAFDNLGDSITGTVLSTEVKAQTDIASGKPLTWDDGSTRQQLVVKLQTALREDGDDDGIRAVYVKGAKKKGSRSLHDAVASAVIAAGGKGLEPGGTLTITHDGVEPSQTRGYNDRKLYSARYVLPDRAAASAGFLGTGMDTTSPPAWAQAAAQAPVAVTVGTNVAPAAQAPAMSPEQAAAFLAFQQQMQATPA